MLTPIKKQGDEHIYILLKIGIIDWVSVCYMGTYRFVWMLIGSEINRDFTLTPDFTLSQSSKLSSLATKIKKHRGGCAAVFLVGAEGVEPPTLCL